MAPSTARRCAWCINPGGCPQRGCAGCRSPAALEPPCLRQHLTQEFIPIAESTGLILPIGEWVLHEAIQQLKRWQDRGLAIHTMAVNLSAVQFRQLDLAERVLRYLEEAALACPGWNWSSPNPC